ncbi:MAG: Spy/CpxP family protein refolding chaperone [Desulfosarcina sp.]|nr:Spy/CpxP family protein refolding chaperone [Desulfosarcina sp.]MBC2743654.1 Spy/CpxP family protein refolding chaperone [Desulfosarcina sp.]MBC2766563.1 Spy/CpxP family protein refolding chaperone [Desulfosarcina sp.]
MKKNVLIVITLCALLLIGSVAACKHGHHPGGFDEFDMAAATDRIASRLDLTESQKADLKQIAREIADKAKAMHTDHESRHQELADLVRQDVIGRDVVDQLITDKMEKMRAMADFAAERLIAFHGTLTPEQRETIAAHIENRSSKGCRFGFR